MTDAAHTYFIIKYSIFCDPIHFARRPTIGPQPIGCPPLLYTDLNFVWKLTATQYKKLQACLNVKIKATIKNFNFFILFQINF